MTIPDKYVRCDITNEEDLRNLFKEASDLGIRWYSGEPMDADKDDFITESLKNFGIVRINFTDCCNYLGERCVCATWE